MACRHLGRIDKSLPCPEPHCIDAAHGMLLIVPIELDELSFTTVALKRVVFVDRGLGRYVRWDTVEGPVHLI